MECQFTNRMKGLTKQQTVQEEQYYFPYHYADFISDKHKLMKFIEQLDLVLVVKNTIDTIKNNKITLDAGCGDGRLCYELQGNAYKVVGIDYSESAIAFARAFNPQAEFFVQDLKNLDVPYKFDIIVLMEVLEHFIPTDIDAILPSLSNVLNDDGHIIITVPSDNMKVTDKHYQHFNKNSLTKTVEPYYDIEELTGYGIGKGCKRRNFNRLKIFGNLFYPFRKDLGLAKKYFEYIKTYYQKNLSVGEPEICNGLIAVCKKKNKT